MLNHVIAFSLKNRLLIVAAVVVLVLFGGYQASQLTIDVFPDLNRPTVTIMTESHGLAPEEVETLVTFPIESAMNGATGVRRVRSASGIGISIVYVEFDWGTDIYVDRQIVAEKLQLVRDRLPKDVNPAMTPIASIMGEIMLVGLRPVGKTTPLEVRTLAEWNVRRRLLGVSGVAQVTVMGGELKQYQVLTSPERLARYDVTINELSTAVEKSNAVSGGGFLLTQDQEKLIRIVGRVTSPDDVKDTVIRLGETVPITIGQVADVEFAGPVKRGDGSVNGQPAVILSVQKQPGADTIQLTEEMLKTLGDIQKQQPGVKIETNIFKQADFIEVAIDNVLEAIRDGAVWVVVVLFLFLWNFRTSAITLTAIPLSILITALVFRGLGVSINTMTLGGLAVAIGELVDDSIVDIENIFRRLRENRHKPKPENPLKVIYLASAEIRNSIVYATVIVVLVVLPLFALPGLEGRLFAPLGLSYLVTLLASLLVSLTVTPVLSAYLLPKARFLEREKDPFLLRWLKWVDTRLLHFVLRHNTAVLIGVAVIVVLSLVSVLWMGGEFLPDFNEGTLTIGMTTPASTGLAESNRLAALAEGVLLGVPEVTHVSRRTGRAELDEHAENVNFSEIDVGLTPPHRPLPGWHRAVLRAVPGLHRFGVEKVGRPREVVLADIRDRLAAFPKTVVFNIGQPISHRLDHIMSGIRAQVAVKIYGEDLVVLRERADDVRQLMQRVPGVVDLQVEQQVEIEQIRVTVLRHESTRHGLPPQDVAEALETAFQGRTVSEVLEGQRVFELVVWFDVESRDDIEMIRNTMLSTPSGARVKLGSVALVEPKKGPNTINREKVMRRIVVQCNTADRDLVSVVEDVQAAVNKNVVQAGKLPEGYFIEYGGQFEAQREANFRLLILGCFAVVGIFLLLYKCFDSWRAAVQVLVNIPLAAIGAVVALLISNWPGLDAFAAAAWYRWPLVWLESTRLSVAHWVGFITLTGIVSRNGIMMISHYIHLMKYEGEEFTQKMIVRGSLERLGPVLMTALCAMIGLVPLALGAGETGKEILHPLAIVVIGGLVSSTLLDQIVTPALFWKFGSKVVAKEAPAVELPALAELETPEVELDALAGLETIEAATEHESRPEAEPEPQPQPQPESDSTP
ncbi:MAG: efflux RND transporter permease subunit [Planctomycetia bacterium]|nr:efflux RND transporter permease subunit [Planctomycetia bacterium]